MARAQTSHGLGRGNTGRIRGNGAIRHISSPRGRKRETKRRHDLTDNRSDPRDTLPIWREEKLRSVQRANFSRGASRGCRETIDDEFKEETVSRPVVENRVEAAPKPFPTFREILAGVRADGSPLK